MTNEEVLDVLLYAEQAFPHTKFGERAGEVWLDALGDLPHGDVMAALKGLVRKQTYIAPAEIRVEVALLRRPRVNQAEIVEALRSDPDDPGAHNRELRDLVARWADGAGRLPADVVEVGRAWDSAAYRQMRVSRSGRDEEFWELRRLANTEECEFCYAPVGQSCVAGDGSVLGAPAHPSRLKRAQTAAAAPRRPGRPEEGVQGVSVDPGAV
jgi:hypothetical protein